VASLRPVVRVALAVASRSAWRAHQDALPVKGQHQQVGIGAGGPFPLGVEAGHIGGRSPGECLELALADPDPARTLESGANLLERPARRLDRGQPPQPVGMPAHGQIQHRVRRVEIGHTARAVGNPGDRDRPEHRGHITLMPSLHPGAHHTVGAGDAPEEPLLARSPQVQVVLEQAAHQLPRALSEPILKLGMGQLTTTRISQPSHNLLEQSPGPVKHSGLCLPQPCLLRVP
jgi:hypothetical protein